MVTKIKLINDLAFHKIKIKYIDQLFGISWSIINPLVYVFCYWFFYLVGVRGTGMVGEIPYIVWLIPGVIIYRFLISCLSMAPSVLASNSLLIKNVKFNVSLIPIIEVIKEFYVHCVTMIILGIIFIVIGYSATGTLQYFPSIYYINFLFYMPLLFLYSLSFVIPISVIALLIKDTKNFITALIQPLFWLTPVAFTVNSDVFPRLELYEKLFNPFYFFISGYRNTMVYNVFFWEHPYYNVYIMCVICFNFLIGIFLWKKVRPYMSDLL